MTKQTWVQDRENSKIFREVTNELPSARVHIHVDNVDFVSPISGTRIRNNRELLDHNKKHGVSNDLDSLRQQTQNANAPKIETRQDRHERKLAIKDAMEQASSSGYNRKVQYDE